MGGTTGYRGARSAFNLNEVKIMKKPSGVFAFRMLVYIGGIISAGQIAEMKVPKARCLTANVDTVHFVGAVPLSVGYSGNGSETSKRNCQSPGVLMLPGPARTTL